MALKFLNKKGWHTGSLRNIETVWKAEQKHESEQKKLEELRKQIHDEREKSEFRLMQEQAGLVPRQERLEFLYDSGLQVGKVSQTDEYLLGKPVDEAVKPENDVAKVAATPGALFVEEKPASANDSWRKLHSDPLFLIRQQEQAAIARIKSNPVKMAEIRKDAEVKKKLKEEKKMKRKEAKRERKEKKKRKKQRASSSEDSSGSDDAVKTGRSGHESDGDADGKGRRKRSPSTSPPRKTHRQSPSKSKKNDHDSRGTNTTKRDYYKGEGSRGELRDSGDWRNRGFDNREDSPYEDRGQMQKSSQSERVEEIRDQRHDSPDEVRDQDRKRRYEDVDNAEEIRDRRPRHDYPEEHRDGDRRRRYDDVDNHRDRSHRNGDRRWGYDDGMDAREAKRLDKNGGRGRYDDADGGRGRSYDYGGQKRVHVEFQESRVHHESDKRRSHGHSDGTGVSKLQDRGKDAQPADERANGMERSKYCNSEEAHNSGSYHDGDRNKRYGLIKDESTYQGRDYLHSSNSGSTDDSRSRKLDVGDRKADRSEVGGEKPREVMAVAPQTKPVNKGRPPKPALLSDAERAARLAEMQSNADLHEEQRWQRLKHAADADIAEVKRAENDKSNDQFMADTRKSMYGTEQFSSASTIEKSVKRRAHFIERSSGDSDKNAFRR